MNFMSFKNYRIYGIHVYTHAYIHTRTRTSARRRAAQASWMMVWAPEVPPEPQPLTPHSHYPGLLTTGLLNSSQLLFILLLKTVGRDCMHQIIIYKNKYASICYLAPIGAMLKLKQQSGEQSRRSCTIV